MKTIKKVEITPVYVEFMPEYETFEEGNVYISKRFGIAMHRCLCGCGVKTVLPIRMENDWKLIEYIDGEVSFTPSIANYQFPCKSHYIITKNVANFV